MHTVIISCSPRNPSVGNTTKILSAFSKGLHRAGVKTELYHLAERVQWDAAQNAFLSGEHIVFGLPLYAENIPGIMMEFLEILELRLRDCAVPCQTRYISFILHSGFPEACQRRCCERYLEMLPPMLHSQYAGILSRGNTFFMSYTDASYVEELISSYEDMGEKFAENGYTFFFPEAAAFTGPEYYTKKEARFYNRVAALFLQNTAASQGCTTPLDYYPYKLPE